MLRYESKQSENIMYDYDIPYEKMEQKIKEHMISQSKGTKTDETDVELSIMPALYKKHIEIFSLEQYPGMYEQKDIKGYMFLNKKRHLISNVGKFVVTDENGDERKRYSIYSAMPDKSRVIGFIPSPDDKGIILILESIPDVLFWMIFFIFLIIYIFQR